MQKKTPFLYFAFAIFMLKRSRILKILVPTPHNYVGYRKDFKIRDRLSIEIAKTKF